MGKGILEKIHEIEEEMARTQKNKATEYHLGLLKAKLARYKSELIESSKSKGPKMDGFETRKSGDARVALVGFVKKYLNKAFSRYLKNIKQGKSTLLNNLTNTESEVASYEFTTLTCIPGVIEYRGSKIQLLDLPGIFLFL
jgi:uncharacterized protein